MPPFSLNQAAKVAGKSKATLLDAIRAGRLSAPKDAQGRYQIDPAELFRVYPPTGQLPVSGTGSYHPEPVPETGSDPLETGSETALLRQKVGLLERIIEGVENERDDLRRRLDQEAAERREAQGRLTALLSYQPTDPPPTTPEPPPTPAGQLNASLRYWVSLALVSTGAVAWFWWERQF